MAVKLFNGLLEQRILCRPIPSQENHFYLRPAELAHLIETIDDPLVGVCLDSLNSIAHLVSPVETITTLAPFIVSVHIKNAVATRSKTGFYISGCPLDERLVDLLC